ncbi:MAG: hypothetical protein ACFE8C_10275 [Promethearchaeota archaeon]
MIQSLFIFRTHSTDVLYNRNFQNEEKVDMFSSFFTSLKLFVSELLASSSTTLDNIKLGAYMISTSHVPEAKIDLVLIYDKEDAKLIIAIIQELSNIVLRNKDLFTKPDIELEQLELFDSSVTEFILSNKKLVNLSELVNDQDLILKSIWDQKGDLSKQVKGVLLKEKESLMGKYTNEENYIKKYQYLLDLIDLSEKLRDENSFIEFQKEAKIVGDIVKDRKIRIKYYLDKAKEAIEYGDYKQVYSFFYSFCKKLEDFAEPDIIEKYQNILNTLTKSKQNNKEEYFKVIKKISKMSDNIDSYFPSRN